MCSQLWQTIKYESVEKELGVPDGVNNDLLCSPSVCGGTETTCEGYTITCTCRPLLHNLLITRAFGKHYEPPLHNTFTKTSNGNTTLTSVFFIMRHVFVLTAWFCHSEAQTWVPLALSWKTGMKEDKSKSVNFCCWVRAFCSYKPYYSYQSYTLAAT